MANNVPTRDIRIAGEEGMNSLGKRLALCLRQGDCVLLMGEMGMGKSVLARAIAHAWGVEGPMPSPSFTILQSYMGRVPVKHFDLYRLEDPAEFYEAGLDEEMDSNSISLVEWPEMTDYRPETRVEVRLRRGDGDDIRILRIHAEGMEEDRVKALEKALHVE